VSLKRGNYRKGIKSQFLVPKLLLLVDNRKNPWLGSPFFQIPFRTGRFRQVRAATPAAKRNPAIDPSRSVGPDIDLDVNERLVILGPIVRSCP